jgi:hypothetical protein
MFPLGQVLSTPGALEAIPPEVMHAALARHAKADWGDVCDEDRGLNDQALKDGSRLLSVYHHEGTKFWIITEATDDAGQRAATTVLLPDES